ncbi:MAG TPA: biotin/lipoyl-containing protein, partial [Thermoanaerobaculia bacterium]
MATEVVMPQMGESIAEGTITRWLVKVGDKVERDQPLFEISTDKVDAEIPSPASGTLLEIRNQEGETVPVNQVVAMIGEAGEQPAASAAAAAPAVPAATPGAEPQPTPTEVQREETAREGAPQPASPEPPPAASAEQATEAEEKEEVQRDSGETAQAREIEAGEEERLRKFSSPLVRSIAAKEGVNLEEVQGTGTHGRVTKDDILGYLEQRKAAPAPAPTPARPAAPAAPAPAAPAPTPAAAPAAAAPPAGQ